jgi:hypothetical protein
VLRAQEIWGRERSLDAAMRSNLPRELNRSLLHLFGDFHNDNQSLSVLPV